MEKIQDFEYDLNSLVDSIAGSVYWKNKNGVYIGCNNAVLKKGNLKSKADLLGKTDYDLWPKQAEAIRETDLQVMTLDKIIEREELVILNDGTELCFSSIKSPLKDKNNNIVGIVGNSFDITLLKKTQKQAEIANLEKTQFLALMSHELRTPLTGIISSANILAEMSNMPPEAVEFINYTKESGNYLLSTINNILDFARLEANKFKIVTTRISLRKTIEEVIGVLKILAQEKELQLSLSYEDTLPEEVIADHRVIRHILTNLVSNAIQFTKQGHINIQVQRSEQNSKVKKIATPPNNGQELQGCFFEIAVSDTGIGIPADKLDLIFNRFSQLEDSYVRKKSHYGSGLGLAIVKKMVELIDGSIKVVSELGKGSTFYFTAKFHY